ncbi:TIGR03987 family protein [Clostridium algoriphilum]|uniref:HsmA family protein n=1 Tax=Clostridium algoriphilum TaxID=198347 RepID=UPI001CF54311|nr:HsmA family protein [Clostridium algoriphilum]MCB2292674.1 TIGR03987 family protein [Clostridium algoriphilum]
MLVISIILVNLALIFYTVSILNEVKRKTLLPWHVVMFCIGLACDILGTLIMYELGGSMVRLGIHDILGFIALLFMLVNAIGSVFVLKKYKNLLNKFYRFSVFAWSIWLVSYILGVTTHM